MNTNEAIQTLKTQLQAKDWFSDVEEDKLHNIVVYVKYLSSEVMKSIPDRVEGHFVLTHFAASKMANSKQFITNASTWQPPTSVAIDAAKFVQDFPKVKGSEVALEKAHDQLFSKDSEFFPVKDTERLANELDRLSSICGDNILQAVFYEVHDGKSALTNFSAKYPVIKKEMEQLYVEYGFETINEEWE
jgi:hypothetical protein